MKTVKLANKEIDLNEIAKIIAWEMEISTAGVFLELEDEAKKKFSTSRRKTDTPFSLQLRERLQKMGLPKSSFSLSSLLNGSLTCRPCF